MPNSATLDGSGTTTGTDFWWSGDTGSGSTGGIRYLTLGGTSSGVALAQGTGGSATTAGQPAPVPFNSRVVNIFNGQLYGSSGVGVGSGTNAVSFRGVFNVGTGLPTAANQFGSLIVGSGTSNAGLQDSAYDFYFADASTLYVGDDDTTAPLPTSVTPARARTPVAPAGKASQVFVQVVPLSNHFVCLLYTSDAADE